MRFAFAILSALLLSLSAFADEKSQEVLIQRMGSNENFSVFFDNPAGDSARTIVFCFSSEEEARGFLTADRAGGVALFKGSSITLKVDAQRTFKTGTNSKFSYVQIECGT